MWITHFMVEGVIVGAVITILLHELAAPAVPMLVQVVVWSAWLLTVSCVFFVPIDISVAFYGRCIAEGREDCGQHFIEGDQSAMVVMWRAVYWTIFMLCWFILPTIQSFLSMGHFTRQTRLRAALRHNLLFYSVIAALGFVLVGFIAISRSLSWSGILGMCIGASSAWALFWLVLLLGYGLVEVPRSLLRQASPETNLSFTVSRAPSLHEELTTAQRNLRQTTALIKLIEDTDLVRLHHPLRAQFEVILDLCPNSQEHEQTGGMEEGLSVSEEDITESLLIRLHRRLKTERYDVVRCSRQWHRLVRQYQYLHAVVTHKQSDERRWQMPSSEPSASLPRVSAWLAYFWHVNCKPGLQLVCGCLASVMSAVVIWCEAVLFPSPDLSPLSHVVHSPHVDGPFIQAFSFTVLGYICLCAFYALFHLRIYRRYQLIPDQATDPTSLVFCSSHMCLLIAPLCYNFLHILHEGPDYQTHQQTEAFSKVMGTMDVLPFLGTSCNLYIPVLTTILCLLTYLGVYSHIPFLSNQGFFFSRGGGTCVEDGRALLEKASGGLSTDTISNTRRSSGDGSSGILRSQNVAGFGSGQTHPDAEPQTGDVSGHVNVSMPDAGVHGLVLSVLSAIGAMLTPAGPPTEEQQRLLRD